MKHEHQSPKHKRVHTLINIGLICFLILIATVGMRGLTSSSFSSEVGRSNVSFTGDKIMVCAIGQCLFI